MNNCIGHRGMADQLVFFIADFYFRDMRASPFSDESRNGSHRSVFLASEMIGIDVGPDTIILFTVNKDIGQAGAHGFCQDTARAAVHNPERLMNSRQNRHRSR